MFALGVTLAVIGIPSLLMPWLIAVPLSGGASGASVGFFGVFALLLLVASVARILRP